MSHFRAATDRLLPDFLIVGTPRSGTTLIQRLASEIPGVKVPPETHFFLDFYPGLRRLRFPLDEATVRHELARFDRLTTSRGLEVDVDLVVELLQGRCDRPAHLFGAITRALAGPSQFVGEKTPDHLRWWKPLQRSYPNIRFIYVIRDPRSVVASRIEAGWGASIPELLASRWRADQREVSRGLRSVPLNLRALIRYEDAVQRPDDTRMAIAQLLGIKGLPSTSEVHSSELFPQWETWKARATEPIAPGRMTAWKSVLTDSQASTVSHICRREMRRFGYQAPEINKPPPVPLSLQWRILRMRSSRWRQRMWIARQHL